MSNRNQILKATLECLKAGRFDKAADLCRPLLAANQNDVDARFFLGVSEGALGRLEEATGHLMRVVALQPGHIDGRRELARLFTTQGKRAEAEAEYRAALRLMPNDAPGQLELGRFLMEDGRAEGAAQQAEAALKLQPNLSAAHNLLAVARVEQGCMDEAIDAFGKAIAADPANAGAYSNLGTALATKGRFEAALAATNDALFLATTDVALHINRAVTLLKSGRLLEGWSENEWRHRKPGREKLPPALRLAKLSHIGGIKGHTVLVYHEEGFGDSLQFLRYVPRLAEAGARVILWMPQELVRLTRDQAGVEAVLTGNITLPRFDFHCPIISLPWVFETTQETVPARMPYIKADPVLAAEWTARLPRTSERKIGLVWAGEPRPYDPQAQAMDRHRSVALAQLSPLTGIEGAYFISLQTGAAAGQIAGTKLHNPMGAVKDFADTAAIIDNLDLIVTVDTAVAHLAGGMGKPVMLLDRYDNCWRWLSGRTDSPWYPTLRIFRQPSMGAWGPAVESAAAALRDFIANG